MKTYKITFKVRDFIVLTGTSKQDISNQISAAGIDNEIEDIEEVLPKPEITASDAF